MADKPKNVRSSRLPKVVAIVGATATGKSALAVRVAKDFKGQIVSADSRQVYKGLDIGTGKITKKEMRRVKHHLLDISSPKKIVSVETFKKEAEKAIEQIRAGGAFPIVTGGTGFYADTLLKGLTFPDVKANPKLRAQLEKKSLEQLLKILKSLDKNRAKTIDAKNKVRLVRAIEIAKTLGKVPKVIEQSQYDVLWIGVHAPKDDLQKKIEIRLLERIKKGMINEARLLHASGLSYKRMENLGLEYRYLARFLKKEITKEEMIEQLKKEIWQYAKRQIVWFKKNKKIKWFSPNDYRSIKKEILNFLKS